METKICTKCKNNLPLSSFCKSKYSADGYFYICKECRKVDKKKYYDNGYNEVMKQRQIDNKEHYSDYNKTYYSQNKETEQARNKEWRSNNKERIKERNHFYYHNNPQHNISTKLRNRIRTAFNRKSRYKQETTEKLLGCSFEFFTEYMRGLLTEGMTMELLINGVIHIDHIIPCDAFDLTIPEHQLVCFHYKNLQPMWDSDNLSKNAKHNITDIDEYVKNYKF